MEDLHGKRRGWVWAELDMAPLAVALKHLTTMAETCGKPVAGGALDDVVVGYVNGGWCADAAVVDALGVVEKKDDIEAVQVVIRAVYLPWLEASALAFQKLVKAGGAALQSKAPASVSDVAKGTAILFADGLRYDLAQKLNSESVRYTEQNLYSRAKQLTGDRDPREHEFSTQLRAFDASKSGNATGLAVLVSLCSALLQKSTKGGLVVIGSLNRGGSVDPVHNAVNVAELAIEKGATTLLVPVSARKQLNDLPDDLITIVNVLYYTDARETLLKAIVE